MLQTDGLSFAFPARGRGSPPPPVLRQLTTRFEPGRVTAVLGPNGAGKSTLLRLLLGTLPPTAGTATLDAHDTHTLSARRRAGGLAYVPQRPSVWAPFTVRQVVALGRFALPHDDAAIDAALRETDLAALADRPFATLSAGQQQRAALARALAQVAGPDTGGTRCLLADEPVAAMDPRHAARALALLAAQARRGLTVLVVLHDFTLAARAADRVLILGHDGSPVADGPVADALTPDQLERAFGMPFRRVETPEGPAILPAPAAASLHSGPAWAPASASTPSSS